MDYSKELIKKYKKERSLNHWKPIFKRFLLILIAVAVVLVLAWEYSRAMVIYYDMIGLSDYMRAF